MRFFEKTFFKGYLTIQEWWNKPTKWIGGGSIDIKPEDYQPAPDEITLPEWLNESVEKLKALAKNNHITVEKKRPHEWLPKLHNHIHGKILVQNRLLKKNDEPYNYKTIKDIQHCRANVEIHSQVLAIQNEINAQLAGNKINFTDIDKDNWWKDTITFLNEKSPATNLTTNLVNQLESLKTFYAAQSEIAQKRKNGDFDKPYFESNALTEANNFLTQFIIHGQDLAALKEKGEEPELGLRPFSIQDKTHPAWLKEEFQKKVDGINAMIPLLKECQQILSIDPNNKIYTDKYNEIRSKLRKKLNSLLNEASSIKDYAAFYDDFLSQLSALNSSSDIDYKVGIVEPAASVFEKQIDIDKEHVAWIYEYDPDHGWYGGMRKVAKPEYNAPPFIWEMALKEFRAAGNKVTTKSIKNGQRHVFASPEKRNEFLQLLKKSKQHKPITGSAAARKDEEHKETPANDEKESKPETVPEAKPEKPNISITASGLGKSP